MIADDVTGACDVGGEFAAAGHAVRVLVDARGAGAGCQELCITNTQSRSMTAEEAARRVVATLAGTQSGVLLKKIDTALRGHLGAELAAAVEASGAAVAFVVPALPALGRATRGGRQWVDGLSLAATEFARDPEGYGAESSIAVVLERECDWPSAVVDVATVRAGHLGKREGELRAAGCRFIIVDAETYGDVEQAVASILTLPRPVCVAGSVPLARALARLDARDVAVHTVRRGSALRSPTLVVCGSLHSRAHAQTAALVAAGLAEREVVDGADAVAPAQRARRLLDAGRNVVVEAPSMEGSPTVDGSRRIEECLAEVAYAVATTGPIGSLVVIGGETCYGILCRLAATELVVRGRPEPLVALAEIATGYASGAMLVTKGGSGGDVEALVRLVTSAPQP